MHPLLPPPTYMNFSFLQENTQKYLQKTPRIPMDFQYENKFKKFSLWKFWDCRWRCWAARGRWRARGWRGSWSRRWSPSDWALEEIFLKSAVVVLAITRWSRSWKSPNIPRYKRKKTKLKISIYWFIFSIGKLPKYKYIQEKTGWKEIRAFQCQIDVEKIIFWEWMGQKSTYWKKIIIYFFSFWLSCLA